MSINSVSSTQVHRNIFFEDLPDDVIRIIFEFFKTEYRAIPLYDDRSILTTAAVCRHWQNHPTLKQEHKQAYTRCLTRCLMKNLHQEIHLLNQYPSELIQVFRNSQKPIFQLPALELGNRMGNTGYIDFITLNEMSQSVMRFKDKYGRPGLLLRIHAHFPDKGIEDQGVLAIFKRYTHQESTTWTYVWTDRNWSIGDLYNKRHDENDHMGNLIEECPNCPFANGQYLNPSLLSALLNGEDPNFSLSMGAQTQIVGEYKES